MFPGEEAYVSIFQTHETKVPTSHFSDIFKPKERIKLEKKITRKKLIPEKVLKFPFFNTLRMRKNKTNNVSQFRNQKIFVLSMGKSGRIRKRL